MAGTIVISSDFVIVDEADSTNFGGTSYSGFEREDTACEGGQVSEGSLELSMTISSTDMSGRTIVGWMLMWNAPDTFANAGFGIVVGDGTNRVAYSVGGTGTPDIQGVFFRNGWQCFQLDCSDPPTDFVTLAGSEASLSMSAITQIGYYMDGTEKALGKVDNAFVDIMRYYLNSGYTVGITAGTSGSPATFDDLADYDFSLASQRALGVMYEPDSGVFEAQAPFYIGDTGTGASYFKSENQELIFIAKPIDNFKFNLLGNATGQNEAYFEGVTFRNVNASINPTFNWTDTNFEYIQADACTFLSIGAITLPTYSANRHVKGSIFDGCAQIDPSTCTFQDNCVRNTTDANGGILLDASGSANWSGLDFVSDGTGHAIYITATGSYTFTNFTYTGYGADDTTDAAVYNNSGGAVTINVSGGDSPTVRNGAGASTSVVNVQTISIHVQDEANNPIQYAQVNVQKQTPDEYTSDTGNNAGDADFVVNEVVDTNTPQTGWILVYDMSEHRQQNYRFGSWTSKTFSLLTEITGSTTSSGGATGLISTTTNFLTEDIEEGDTVRNTTDGSWAVVDEIVDADNITTTPLLDGTENDWDSGDGFSFHRLAKTYEDAIDTVEIPLLLDQTNASGDVSKGRNYTGDVPVDIQIRTVGGSTDYKPFETVGTFESDGLSVTAVLIEDEVYT